MQGSRCLTSLGCATVRLYLSVSLVVPCAPHHPIPPKHAVPRMRRAAPVASRAIRKDSAPLSPFPQVRSVAHVCGGRGSFASGLASPLLRAVQCASCDHTLRDALAGQSVLQQAHPHAFPASDGMLPTPTAPVTGSLFA
eukprot:TRINITY_DN2413_c0_g2_i1.p1 TRINITY_DN2413_c0_g2~~TRINITY_DN2413_c0_g2_i1.p1  ORF type:complete len:139 (+),score=1.59 TRINITY_DN2413_c0_g2_i1:240-656(+)